MLYRGLLNIQVYLLHHSSKTKKLNHLKLIYL